MKSFQTDIRRVRMLKHIFIFFYQKSTFSLRRIKDACLGEETSMIERHKKEKGQRKIKKKSINLGRAEGRCRENSLGSCISLSLRWQTRAAHASHDVCWQHLLLVKSNQINGKGIRKMELDPSCVYLTCMYTTMSTIYLIKREGVCATAVWIVWCYAEKYDTFK